MPKRPSLFHSVQQRHVLWALLVLAAGIGGWSTIQYLRLLPIQKHIDKGLRFQSVGNTQEAEREWKEAVRLDPNNTPIWEMLGDLYLSQNNFKAAQEAFDTLFRLAPDTPDLKARMAIVAYQLRDNDKARDLAKSELKVNKDSIAALQVLVNVDKGNPSDESLASSRHLVELRPQSVDALNSLIDELHTRDAYDQIVPLADRLVKLAPTSADSYLRRGISLYISNPAPDSLARATKDLRHALQLDPQNVEAHRYLGRIYLRQNHPRLAIAEFEAIAKGRPYASAHLLELSQAYRRIGNKKRAYELQVLFNKLRQTNAKWLDLSNQTERDPTNISNYAQLVSLLIHQALGADTSLYHLYSFQVGRGQLLTIQEYLDKAGKISPKNSQLVVVNHEASVLYNHYLTEGEKKLDEGDYSLANESIARVVLIRPTDPRSLNLTRRIQGAGLNPFPVRDAAAIPDPHQR